MPNTDYDVNAEITKFFANHTADKNDTKNHAVKYCGCGCNGNYNQHKENFANIYMNKVYGDIS